MLRKSTDFAGWQSQIDYLAQEAERQKAAEVQASVALSQREAKVPYVGGKVLLWLFLGTVAGLLFAYWVFDKVMDSVGL